MIDTGALLSAIDRYIAKADEDLEETMTAEGYVGAKMAVDLASKLEEAVDEALEADSLVFLEKVQEATDVAGFIADTWTEIKDTEDLRKILYDIFRERFDEMLRSFTYEWILAENPVIAGVDEKITKPAEAFVKGWSDELAKIMHLNTKDTMERLLLKAQDEGWSVDKLTDAIGDSGIRNHGYRSRRVALTEMLRMESYSQQEAMVQNPLAYKKRWRHVMSANPRENHMMMHGQEVFKREFFELTGADGSIYSVLCPRDTNLPASESVNCHCLMETIADKNAVGMTDEELKASRQAAMDKVNAEYEAWEKKFKEDFNIDKPSDDPSVTWEMYNSYYEAYRRGEIK